MERRAKADEVRFFTNQPWYDILKLSGNHIYTGCTSDLDERICRYQKGYIPATKTHLPASLIFFCVFRDKYKAFDFERYLKSGSGRAFMSRHLI